MKATPIAGTERIVTLDIIRGFALLGIFLVNIPTFFSPDFIHQMYSLPENLSPVDRGIRLFYDLFVQTKFYTIFSFLFGLGFYIFMSRAAQKGLNVNLLFTRRLIVLLFFGLCHLIFLWYGDILHMYAIVGLLLLLFYKQSDQSVIGWAFALLLMYYASLSSQLLLTSAADLQQQQEIGREKLMEAVRMYQDASYGEWIAYRLKTEVATILSGVPFMIPVILPLFLFGLYVGRRGVLHEPLKHMLFIRRVWLISLALGIPLTVIVALLDLDIISFGVRQSIAHDLFVSLNGLTLCFFYISSLTLLLQKPKWQKRLRPLAFVGQMALTNYLLQTIISVLIAFQFDLFNRMSLWMSLLLCLGIYSIQVLFSFLWLRRYRFGPFEWLWRSLTYGYIQPLKRKH